MGKLLKPLVVILLLVNGGAAYLGYMVFNQRTVIKAATQTQSKAIAEFAEALKDDDIAAAARNGLGVPADGNLTAMTETLDKVKGLAAIKQNNIEELQNDLAAEKTLRQQKEKELELTKADLEATKGDLEEAEDNLAQTKSQLADAEAKVGGLNNEIADLKSSIDGLEASLSEKEDKVIELADNVRVLKKENHELFLQTPAGRAFRPPTPDEIRELSGTVIAARPDFNFVVLDLGAEKGMQANLEALIHRDKKLIARVRITRVEDDLCIADILPDWRLDKVAEGDKVMFDVQ